MWRMKKLICGFKQIRRLMQTDFPFLNPSMIYEGRLWPRTPSRFSSCRLLGSSVSCGSLIEERGGTAAMIKAPVGAAPVLFLTRTSRGESQRESKVSPLTQSQRLIYVPSQFPAAAANQDVVKVAAQLFLFFLLLLSPTEGPRGRRRPFKVGKLLSDACFIFIFFVFF